LEVYHRGLPHLPVDWGEMKSIYINCPRCKEKQSVLKQEIPNSGEWLNYGCQGYGVVIRIIQWRCGYCSYHKVKFNVNNEDWVVLE
jgi:hypothetical protein